MLFGLDIRVSAGIDLSGQPGLQLLPTTYDSAGRPGLLVRLPPARIVNCDADESSIHQYFIYEYGLGRQQKLPWLEVQDEIGRAKERASNDAIQHGLLDTAWQNAAQAITAFFHLSGFGEVRVEPETRS